MVSADDSMFAPIRDEQGRVRGLMDRATADYFASTNPNPDQKDLDELFTRVVCVQITTSVLDFGETSLRLLYETQGSADIASLRKLLTLAQNPGCGHCMCPGFPIFNFLDGKERLAQIILVTSESIRWGIWKDDALLADGEQIVRWLDARGIDEPLKEYIEEQEERRLYNIGSAEWLTTVPACLKPLGKLVLDAVDVEPARAALLAAQPDANARIRILLEWVSYGVGMFIGCNSYEQVPISLLMDYSTDALIALAEKNEVLSEREIVGARRLFASPEFAIFHKARGRVPARFR